MSYIGGNTNPGNYIGSHPVIGIASSFPNFRNRIINGDMRIDQRNAGSSVTVNGNAFFFTVDRFAGLGNGPAGVFTLQQDSSAPAGFVNSIKATVTTIDSSISSENYRVQHKIEGSNVADLSFGTASAKTITLSFWVRSSETGAFGASIKNSAANRSYPFTYSISSADTWEYKTVTITGDTTGTWLTDTGTGIWITWSLGGDANNTAGAWVGSTSIGATGQINLMATLNATWYITGVQLEEGTVATPFEHRPYGTELSLCQRYYQTLSHMLGICSSSSTAQAVGMFPTSMRSTPEVGASGVLNIQGDGVINATQSAVSVSNNNSTKNSLNITCGNFSGLVQSRALYVAVPANNSNVLILNAEL